MEERVAAAESEAKAAGLESLICVNAALLYRTPQALRCGAIIEVRAPLLARIRRAKTRDGISAGGALRRILRQRSFWRLRPASGRPVVPLRNAGGPAALEAATRLALEAAIARSRDAGLRTFA